MKTATRTVLETHLPKTKKIKVQPQTVPVATKVDGQKQYPPAGTNVSATKPGGRGKITEELSPADLKKEINTLLQELRDATDLEEKKGIRRKLRLRGHRGGLGVVQEPAAVKA